MESSSSSPFENALLRQPFNPLPMSTTPSLFDHRQPVRSMPMASTLDRSPSSTTMPRMPECTVGPFGLNRSMDEINKQLDWFVSYMNSNQRMRSQVPSATATSGQPSSNTAPYQPGSSNFASGLSLPGSAAMPFPSNSQSTEDQVELLIKGWIGKKLYETDMAPSPLKKGHREGFGFTQLEEVTLRCLCNAFAFLNQVPSNSGLVTPEADMRFHQFYCEKLLAACMMLPGYSKLTTLDQYTLINHGWPNVLSVKNHLTTIARANAWQIQNQSPNPATDHSTFYKLCLDPMIFFILVAIIIYNPDLVKLQGIEQIRLEQCSYIYLLRRYLENLLGSVERAKMEHYKLIYTIEKIMIIRQQTLYIEQFRRIQNHN